LNDPHVLKMIEWLEQYPSLLFLFVHLEVRAIQEWKNQNPITYIEDMVYLVYQDAVENHGYTGPDLTQVWNEKMNEMANVYWDEEKLVEFLANTQHQLAQKHIDQIDAKSAGRYHCLMALQEIRRIPRSKSLYKLAAAEVSKVERYLQKIAPREIADLQSELKKLVEYYGKDHPAAQMFARFVKK
jgi:hypothetical protein